jgi:heme exporter protein D
VSYLPYIVGAYAVFASVLLWDGVSPWLKYRRLLRAIRQKAARATARDERSGA